MVTYEEALKLTIEGDAVFLVGSGFSTGAENVSENEDRHLLVGSELAKELANLTGMDSGVPLDIVSQEYIDMYGEDKLIDYLKSHYMVDTYAEYYKALARWIFLCGRFFLNYPFLFLELYSNYSIIKVSIAITET